MIATPFFWALMNETREGKKKNQTETGLHKPPDCPSTFYRKLLAGHANQLILILGFPKRCLGAHLRGNEEV